MEQKPSSFLNFILRDFSLSDKIIFFGFLLFLTVYIVFFSYDYFFGQNKLGDSLIIIVIIVFYGLSKIYPKFIIPYRAYRNKLLIEGLSPEEKLNEQKYINAVSVFNQKIFKESSRSYFFTQVVAPLILLVFFIILMLAIMLLAPYLLDNVDKINFPAFSSYNINILIAAFFSLLVLLYVRHEVNILYGQYKELKEVEKLMPSRLKNQQKWARIFFWIVIIFCSAGFLVVFISFLNIFLKIF